MLIKTKLRQPTHFENQLQRTKFQTQQNSKQTQN